MPYRFRLLLVLWVALFTGCERSIDLKLDQTEPKLVVEATIENGQFPIVILSKSLDFFSQINPAVISQSFVRRADVFVSNGIVSHKLREYTYQVAGYDFYYYSANVLTPSTLFRGELNMRYGLRIVVDGKEYTATTTIPDTTRKIDTLYAKPAPAGNDPRFRALMGRFTDRPGLGDYVRYFTKRNSDPFYPGLNSVFDDQIIDGTSYEIQVERGVDRGFPIEDGYSYFNAGDTVTLKLSNIDKPTYDFWRTMEFVFANQGNPFGTPTKVLSNISGNALGYFGGYASKYRTIIIPR
ncbi:MAG: DUF4249 domain-containing protein [Chitinophagaceae bacterium]|nr:DUF4249 domain-containing protein [Chitinophagaceae bacterium]